MSDLSRVKMIGPPPPIAYVLSRKSKAIGKAIVWKAVLDQSAKCKTNVMVLLDNILAMLGWGPPLSGLEKERVLFTEILERDFSLHRWGPPLSGLEIYAQYK
ncbi:hypothetical protein ACLOJK_037606 [Asimina triloba]